MADDVTSQASIDASTAARPHWSPPDTVVDTTGSSGIKGEVYAQHTDANQRARNKTAGASGTKPLVMRHKGGPINKTGAYKLKRGEHVLAPAETKKLKGMMNGIKSLDRK